MLHPASNLHFISFVYIVLSTFLCILGLLHVFCCVLSASNKSHDDDDDDDDGT